MKNDSVGKRYLSALLHSIWLRMVTCLNLNAWENIIQKSGRGCKMNLAYDEGHTF